MAAITTTTSGPYNTGSTYTGGVVPVEGDSLTITKIGTATDLFLTDAAGYAIGATAITLSSTVAAGSYVVGETVQFGTDKNYYKISAWNSATKVLTVAPLIIAIPAAQTLVYNKGCMITDDGTNIVGDDTQTAVICNGTWYASRAVSSQKTFKGSASFNTGTLDLGNSYSPMPVGVTTTFIGNYSAALAANKYVIRIQQGAVNYCWMFGAARTRNTTSTALCAASQAAITVADVTGWQVSDQIAVAGTVSTAQQELKTILSIVGNVVTMTTNFTNAHASGCYVSNMTSNVVVKPYNNTYQFPFVINQNATNLANTRELQHVQFLNGGNGSVNTTLEGDCFGALSLSYGTQNAYSTFINLKNLVFLNTGSGVYATDFRGGYSYRDIITDSAAYGFTSGACNARSGSTGGFLRLRSYHTNVHVVANYSQGGVGFTFDSCNFTGGNLCHSLTSGTGHTMTNCTYDCMTAVVSPGYGGDVNFNTCYFGTGVGTPTITNLVTFGTGFLEKTYFNNCTLGSVTNDVQQTTLNQADTADLVQILNRNGDPTNQQIYTRLGNWSRDNSTSKNSKSSLKLTTGNSNNCTYSQTVPTSNGVPVTIAGSVQHNAAYVSGAFTLPTVTISGLGIAPQTFTAVNNAGVWQPWTFTATQSSGYDGNLTVTYTGQSATATGTVNFDGLISTVFVTYARFYGYQFNTSNPVLTVDPVIQLSESAAGALTGMTDDGTNWTFTSTHSIREAYDHDKYLSTRAANLGRTPAWASTDGVNFTCNRNIILNGGSITGTGAVTTAGTLTITAAETSTVTIAASNGTSGYLYLSGLSGHSVYLQDGSAAQKDYQASVTGTYSYFFKNGLSGTWTYTVAKYGSTATSGTVAPASGGNTSVAISLLTDSGITQATAATVAAYTSLTNFDQLYDYAAYYQTTNAGIKLSRLVAKAGTGISLGAANLAVNTTAGSVFSYSSPTITIKCSALAAGSTYPGTLITTGTLTFLNGATTNCLYTDSIGSSSILTITGLSAHAVYVQNGSAVQQDYQSSVTGTYSLWIPNTASGTWTYVVKKAGYNLQRGTLTPTSGGLTVVPVNTPQKLKADGSVMYTGTSSSLCNIAFNGTTQANIQIGNGEVLLSNGFDMTETALATNTGMIWLAANGECSIFISFGGSYLFMTSFWRLQRWHAGDGNATFDSFVTSQQGGAYIVDITNGSVQFLTSTAPKDVADAVMASIVEGTVTVKQSLQIANAANAGKTSGMQGTSGSVRNLADNKDRVFATLDGLGNRTAVTLNLD